MDASSTNATDLDTSRRDVRPIAARGFLFAMFAFAGSCGCVGDHPYRAPRTIESLLEGSGSEIADDRTRHPTREAPSDTAEGKTRRRERIDSEPTSSQTEFLKLVSGEGPFPVPRVTGSSGEPATGSSDGPPTGSSGKSRDRVGSSIRFDDTTLEFAEPDIEFAEGERELAKPGRELAEPELELAEPGAAEFVPLPSPALSRRRVELPLRGGARGKALASSTRDSPASADGSLVTVSVRDTPLHSVLSLIAEQQGLSIVAPSGLETPITVTLQPTTLERALDAVMAISGCTWTRDGDVIFVTQMSGGGQQHFRVQGREIRVFDLDYVDATDTEAVITGLLSPVGKMFARQVDSDEKRKTREQLVVEDLPEYLERIEAYLTRADRPPQQVMVEARLLHIALDKETRHGVNYEKIIARLGDGRVTLHTDGFLTDTGPNAMLTVAGTDFDSVVDFLTSTTDSKTLAAPKILMVNGQESKIQIGRRLGYFVTTTTQTSTLQDVQFLEVGVVLTVTPQITADGQVLMKVHPKVSTGDINATTTLPEEETTEVETSVMVPDGHGVIIGGLIQEHDIERQTKLPLLGDIWMVGRLFQRRSIDRTRGEIVVALRPRIVPYGGGPTPEELYQLHQIETPLLSPDLHPAPRPEPHLKDAVRDPVWPEKRRK